MNSYELSRHWFNWAFENPEKVKPIHSAVYFFAMEHCNRLGNKSKFGFPSQMTMDAIGVRKIQTYSKAFNDLVEWGFFILVERSKNQYSANIISISAVPKNGTARGKALDKANIQHGAKQGHDTGQSMGQSKDTIIKPLTNKPINQEQINILLKKEPKEGINFSGLLGCINSAFSKKLKVINATTQKKFNARLKDGYSKDDIFNAITNASHDEFHKESNFKWCTPEYFSRSTTLDKYGFESQPVKAEKLIVPHYNENYPANLGDGTPA